VSSALGIWPVRREAERLAQRLAQQLGAELFRPWEREETQKTQFRAQFAQRSHWVLIMATGIATRFVDGLLEDKREDPAVVVLDEAGRYAIPLLGGHEAGANSLAYRVASAVGAVPVLTTATEAIKPFVIGVGCRKGVEEEQIDRAVRYALDLCDRPTRSASLRKGSCSLSVGEASAGEQSCLEPPDFSVHDATEFSCVRELVTVDLKANEPALVSFSRRHGIPLRVIYRHQIEARSWVTQPSEWVRQSVGLDGVCEPCALIACARGRLVVPKTTLEGVAVAVVEDNWEFTA
jgi:cobalt-precorrin 5A hydrolase